MSHFCRTKRPLFITTDRSDLAIGFLISQERNGVMYPVSFAGRTLRDFEESFSTHEKEVFAIIEALKQNHRFLYKSFIVYTDSRNMTYLKNLKTDAGRLGRLNFLI